LVERETTMGIDDFLQHRTSERGAYLSKWKEDGKVNTWMHTERLPMAVWRHGGIPKVVVLEDKKTGESVRHVWSGDWVCHEDESVLKNQYKLEDGVRKFPALYCPICRLIDYLRKLEQSGRKNWKEPVFRWEADDEDENLQLTLGGMFMSRKHFEDMDISEDEARAMKKAGIAIRDIWKQNIYPKASYLFCVVDDQHPESGVQKAFNTSSLGDAVKDVIADRREALGAEEGDPTLHPYCIQWQYREKEKNPKDKYHALAMDKIKLTPAVRSLITGPPPDISRDVRPFNLVEMRAFLEEAALMKLPWDDIFDVKKRVVQEVEEEPRPTRKPKPRDDEEPEPRPSRSVAGGAPGKKEKGNKRPPFPGEDDDNAVACEGPLENGEECGQPIWSDETLCPHCGAEYDQDGKLVPKEKPKGKLRKRSEAAEPEEKPRAATKKSAKQAPAPEESRPAPRREPGDDAEEDLDPIPFAWCEMDPGERWNFSKSPKWLRG
jgi:hypothetical protein